MTPYLSVKAALEFRESIGGEQEIQAYCNTLALRGGKRMAEILGTETIDPQGEYTGPMVNVRLPLPAADGESGASVFAACSNLMNEVLEQHDCFVAVFVHNGQCFQIFNMPQSHCWRFAEREETMQVNSRT